MRLGVLGTGTVGATIGSKLVVLGLVAQLGRPVTVFDVVRTALDDAERNRRVQLICGLRRARETRER